MSEPKLTEAQIWALVGLMGHPHGMSPSEIGQHMSDRPNIGRKGPAKLNRSQGFGRLGAYMASLLRKRGFAASAPAHSSGPTYTCTRITDLGRAALSHMEPKS